jgi:hypothetical protein
VGTLFGEAQHYTTYMMLPEATHHMFNDIKKVLD